MYQQLLKGNFYEYKKILIVFFIIKQVYVVRDKIIWFGVRMRKFGEGMSNYENNNVKGQLFIIFDIDFFKGIFIEEEKEGKEI